MIKTVTAIHHSEMFVDPQPVQHVGQVLGGHVAAGTRSVLNPYVLTEIFFGGARKRAHLRIGGTAGRPWHDQCYRLRRKLLRCGRTSKHNAKAGEYSKPQRYPDHSNSFKNRRQQQIDA
jgi:hypothetical protein